MFLVDWIDSDLGLCGVWMMYLVADLNIFKRSDGRYYAKRIDDLSGDIGK